jgi:VWFA-related protein
MKLRFTIAVMVLLAVAGMATPAQQPTLGEHGSSFNGETSNVIVPALVRDAAGKVVYTLQADDFVLTDDGVPQELTLLQDTGGEPLALVIVIESGGAGAREFQKYERLVPPLAPMLWSILGNVYHRVAVVTFDSSPKLIQSFSSDLDEAAATLRDLSVGCSRQNHHPNCSGPKPVHDKPMGDGGAAIIDSLVFAVDMLRSEPAGYRRTILLVSETVDRGSEMTMEQAMRAITDTNTTIYAIGFSPTAADSLLKNVPATVARLTGGEYFKMGSERNLEQDLMAIGNHLPNRYILSFHPQAPHPGLHVLTLKLPDYEGLEVTARTRYWADTVTPATAER